jgi:Ca-activated chloride channel homolog
MMETVSFKFSHHQKHVPTTGLEKAYLLIELEGKAVRKMERSPINLSLVLDRSGSMSGAPLEYCKEASKFVVSQLTDKDLFSLVVFDDEVDTVIQPDHVIHKDLLKKHIDQIDTRGMTNISGGLMKGCQHVLKQKKGQFVNRVILLSDGNANVGITEHNQMMKVVQEYQKAGLTISTMGVGDYFDEEMMEGIADHGKGNYYFINQLEEIPDIFAKELEGLLSVVAQNLSLQITPKDGIEITNIFGYTYKGHELSLGDMFADETKSILIEYRVPGKIEGIHDVFDITWSFVDVTDGVKTCEFNCNIPIEFTKDLNKLSSKNINEYVQKQVEITKTAQIIEVAMDLFDEGNVETGKAILQEQAAKMSNLATATKDEELMLESNLLFNQLENFNYSKQKRKELHQQKYRNMKRKK